MNTETTTVPIKLDTYGRAGKKWNGAVKLGPTIPIERKFLNRMGWELAAEVNGARSYEYWNVPATGAKAVINAEVPTREAMATRGNELHACGEPWAGEFLGWPARYLPRAEFMEDRIVAVDPETEAAIYEQVPLVRAAEFLVGTWDSSWSAQIIWRESGEVETYYGRALILAPVVPKQGEAA